MRAPAGTCSQSLDRDLRVVLRQSCVTIVRYGVVGLSWGGEEGSASSRWRPWEGDSHRLRNQSWGPMGRSSEMQTRLYVVRAAAYKRER